MSDATEACWKWQRENRELMWQLEGRDRDEALFAAGFAAGQVAALEDAAATPFAEEAGVSWEDCDPATGDQVIYRESMREFLTARAAELSKEQHDQPDA